MNDEKEYLIGKTPVSAWDLIKEACNYDLEFANESLQTTREAARILRENGFLVSRNPNSQEAK